MSQPTDARTFGREPGDTDMRFTYVAVIVFEVVVIVALWSFSAYFG